MLTYVSSYNAYLGYRRDEALPKFCTQKGYSSALKNQILFASNAFLLKVLSVLLLNL